MKRLLSAVCVIGVCVIGICASRPAFSQSSVTLYGIVDTGLEFVTHAKPTGGSVVRVPTISGEVPSRWGVKGVEDLGGGLKAIFALESTFAPGTGSLLLGGREFGRASWVGLTSDRWGQLTIGRQQNMTYYGTGDSDVIGPAAIGFGLFDEYLGDLRDDNTVLYRKTFGNLSLGATYSFGRDSSVIGNCGGQVPGDSMACRAITAMVKYDSTSWGAAVIYDEQRGGAGAAAINVLPGRPGVAFTSPGDVDRRYLLNGYYIWNGIKIGGGWLHRRLQGDSQNVTTDLNYLGVSIAVRAWIFDSEVSHIQDNPLDADGTLVIARATYKLSRRTKVYCMAGYMFNSKNGAYTVSGSSLVPSIPSPGVGQADILAGIQHSF
jgi:predicted porin